MHVNFFGSMPFHAIGESECTIAGTKRRERRAHAGVGNRARCQAVVIVRFGEVHQESVGFGNADGLRQVGLDLPAVVVLK